jgi:predicted MFS family arabinose efflux permease
MKLPVSQIARRQVSALSDIKEGLRYTVGNKLIRTIIISMGVLSLFGLSLMTLLPAWSANILGGDAKTYGLLLSGRGIGALIGALMIAAYGRYNVRGKLWTIGSLSMPVLMIAFAMARWLPLSLAIIIITGWSFMVMVNTANAMTQTQVDDHLRGRVMSIYTLVFFGGMPIGALITGNVAEKIGEPGALLINAVLLLTFSIFVFLRLPYLRRQG